MDPRKTAISYGQHMIIFLSLLLTCPGVFIYNASVAKHVKCSFAVRGLAWRLFVSLVISVISLCPCRHGFSSVPWVREINKIVRHQSAKVFFKWTHDLWNVRKVYLAPWWVRTARYAIRIIGGKGKKTNYLDPTNTQRRLGEPRTSRVLN